MSSRTYFVKWLILVTALALASVNVISAGARVQHQRMYDEDPQSKPEFHKQCAMCHTDEDDKGKLSDFGKAFQKAEHEFTPEIRKKFPQYFLAETEKPAEKGEEPTKHEKLLEFESFEKRTGPSVRFAEEDGVRDPVGNDAKEKTARELPGNLALNPALGREIAAAAQDVAARSQQEAAAAQAKEKVPGEKTKAVAQAEDKKKSKVYRQADVRLINLPTPIPIPKGSLWNDYTHRWPNGDTTSASTLYGLDSRAIPSFGFLYGVTDRIHVGAYRSPGDLGRPIQLFAGLGVLNESKGHPLSMMARVGIEGRDNFKRNFATSVELSFARSITKYAQLYATPTVTFGDRPYNVESTQNAPGETAYAMGLGGTVMIRPSVALLMEANYRLNEKARYIDADTGNGIRRPVVGFGVQKIGASKRHVYTLSFTNGGGTTMSQRSMTRGLQGQDDTLRGLTVGFNLTRRIF